MTSPIKRHKIVLLMLLVIFLSVIVSCGEGLVNTNVCADEAWDVWPAQPLPKGIVICSPGQTHGEQALSFSLAGLVAQHQQTGALDELVWIETGGDYMQWFSAFMERSAAEYRGEFSGYELLERYQKQDIVKGYILYETSSDKTTYNHSFNIATSYAGVLGGVLIEITQEQRLKEMGYKLLLDARYISREQCVSELDDKASRRLVVTMPSDRMNNIDLAIANKAFVTHGTDAITERILSRNTPGTPVVGWNVGNEEKFVAMASKYGLFNTASDWCMNLPVLSAGAKLCNSKPVKSINPQNINFDSDSSYHCFIMSDGDNMQWTMSNFINHNDYWGSSLHGSFPLGFTSCPVNLGMMAPDVYDALQQSQPAITTLIEYGAGYFYPDLYASVYGSKKRKALLRAYAKHVNVHMQRLGISVFGFICMDFNAPETSEAVEVFAEELEGITGMIAVQYAPYHGGAGKVLWVKNKQGIEIPVLSAKFALWKDLSVHNGGGVSKIAGSINDALLKNPLDLSFTIVHAWSSFENPVNSQESASGLMPVKWCIDLLDKKIKVVSPEELLWRIRMLHSEIGRE